MTAAPTGISIHQLPVFWWARTFYTVLERPAVTARGQWSSSYPRQFTLLLKVVVKLFVIIVWFKWPACFSLKLLCYMQEISS